MCGFLGGVFTRPLTGSDTEAFRTAVRTLQHRGPDAEGVLTIPEANAVLSFRRLSIIDHETGHQPMSTGRGQHIVFNGEIYNYRELRAPLERAGVHLRTKSDTETLLWKLTLQEIRGLDDLVGMFGCAFLDCKRQSLLLARDRLGVKQVYFTQVPAGFFFASEPKALLALPWVKGRLAEEQLPAYFTFRSVPSPATLFQGISKLKAGTALRFDIVKHRYEIEQYWQVPESPQTDSVSIGVALDQFEGAFSEAVRRRLVADVPVGAFLSGGLDSSLVVAAMSRLGHPDISTFCATFPGSPDNEADFAKRVSSRFNTRHFERPTYPAEFVAALRKWVDLNDDLVADASCLPLLAVSQLAREQGCIVLLSGEGADELFAGYGSYHKYVALNKLHRVLGSQTLRNKACEFLQAMRVIGGQDTPRAWEYLVRGGAYMGTAALLGMSDLASLLAIETKDLPELPRAKGNRLVDLCAFDFIRRIPDDLLVRTDRATMGASIEARVPFLDHNLVELVVGFPGRLRSLPGFSKVLPRFLAQRWGVPYQTIVHRKLGFQLPLGAWFRHELRPLWINILRERLLPLDYDYVSRIVDSHWRGEGQYEEILWRIAALEMWHRRWISDNVSTSVLADVGDISRPYTAAVTTAD